VRGRSPAPETLPLSALPAPIEVTIEVARAGRSGRRTVAVASGSLVRDLVRAAGYAPEGCAVLIGGVSVPMDTPVVESVELTIVPTFSGG
jgi:sulfur carrier protein ThiS